MYNLFRDINETAGALDVQSGALVAEPESAVNSFICKGTALGRGKINTICWALNTRSCAFFSYIMARDYPCDKIQAYGESKMITVRDGHERRFLLICYPMRPYIYFS